MLTHFNKGCLNLVCQILHWNRWMCFKPWYIKTIFVIIFYSEKGSLQTNHSVKDSSSMEYPTSSGSIFMCFSNDFIEMSWGSELLSFSFSWRSWRASWDARSHCWIKLSSSPVLCCGMQLTSYYSQIITEESKNTLDLCSLTIFSFRTRSSLALTLFFSSSMSISSAMAILN